MTSSANASSAAVLAGSEPSPVALIQQRALRGIAALIVRYGVAIAINLAGTIVLSRLLGPAIWGVFAVAQVIYMSSQEVLGRGIATYLIKKGAAPSTLDVRNTFALQHLVGLFFLAAVSVAARPVARWYGQAEMFPLLLAAAVASYGYAWRSVPVALLEREFAYVRVALVEVLDSVFFSGVAIFMAWHGHAIGGLFLAMVSRGVLPTIAVFALRPVRPSVLVRRGSLRETADFGLTVAGSSLVNIAILSVPALFVGKLAGMGQLGLAQMAFALYANLLFATAAVLRLNVSIYSRLVQYPGELHRNVNQHLEILSVLLVPGIVLFAGLSPLWTEAVLGPKWRGLSVLLLAQAPGYLFASVFWGVLSPALTVSGKHRLLLGWLLGFAGCYALLAWRLTLAWGALGVAVAFSLTEVVLNPFLFHMYSKLHSSLRCRKIFSEIAVGAVFLGIIWITAARRSPVSAAAAAFYLAFWCVRALPLLGRFRGLALLPQ